MKRALLVGIDKYDSFQALGGCVNDVNALAPLLSRNEDGSPNFDCQTRTSTAGRIDRRALLSAVEGLLAPGADVGLVQKSKVPEVLIILDCCFAGAAGGVPQLGKDIAAIRPGVSLLSASRGDQAAAEASQGRGIFSTYLCGALEGGAADVLGKVTVVGVYAYLSESFGPWEQRPTFKANVDRLHE